MYRSSIERHHAPYRGVTSRADAVNFDLAVIHDMLDIQKRSGNHPKFDGHKQQIQRNLSAIYTGESNVTGTAPTAGTITHTIGQVEGIQDLSTWRTVGDAQVTKTETGYRVRTNGTAPQSGADTVIPVNAGDIIQIRLKVTAKTYNQTLFGVGALAFEGEDKLSIQPLENYQDGKYLVHRLKSTATQDMHLVVYGAYETTSNQPVEWTVSDFSVSYLSETPVFIQSTEDVLKTELAVQKQILEYIESEKEERR